MFEPRPHPNVPSEHSQPGGAAKTKSTAVRPRWRTSTWFAIWAAGIALVALLIFILQNTQSVEITFLWMHGELPLAWALLIAAIAGGIITPMIGLARRTRRHFFGEPH